MSFSLNIFFTTYCNNLINESYERLLRPEASDQRNSFETLLQNNNGIIYQRILQVLMTKVYKVVKGEAPPLCCIYEQRSSFIGVFLLYFLNFTFFVFVFVFDFYRNNFQYNKTKIPSLLIALFKLLKFQKTYKHFAFLHSFNCFNFCSVFGGFVLVACFLQCMIFISILYFMQYEILNSYFQH